MNIVNTAAPQITSTVVASNRPTRNQPWFGRRRNAEAKYCDISTPRYLPFPILSVSC